MGTRSAEELRRELRDLDRQRRGIEEEISILSEKLNAPGQPGLKGSLLDKEGFPRADIDVAQVRRDRHRLICLTNDHKALSDKLAGLLAQLHAATRAQAASSTANGNSSGSGSGSADVPRAASGAASASGGAPEAATAAARGAADVGSGSADRVNGTAPMELDRPVSAAAAEREPGGVAASGAVLVPFALIDEVTGGSPAALAGVQVGDLLCAFGDVSAGHIQAQAQAPEQGPVAAPAGGSAALLQRMAGALSANEGRPVATTVLRQGGPLELALVPQRWAGRGLLGCHLQPL